VPTSSLVLVVSARLSTTDTDAARRDQTIAYTQTTSSNYVMVVRHATSTTVAAYALRIMS
jgi:hypothetical protein